ncbi:MAG: hypothetical protein V4543_13100, partial [Bacteroidota bacterium]
MHKFTRTLLLFLPVFVLGLSGALAKPLNPGGPRPQKTFYVSNSGTDGVVATPDTDRAMVSSTPWKTIAWALKYAKRGDIVKVAYGTYAERLSVNRGITLQGIPDGGGNYPVLTGGTGTSNGYLTAPDSVKSIVYVSDSNATFQYLQFEINQSTVTCAIFASPSGSYLTQYDAGGTGATGHNKKNWNHLSLLDCKILGTKANNNGWYNYDYWTCGLYLVGYTGNLTRTDADFCEEFIMKRSYVGPKNPANFTYIGKGVRVTNGKGLIGGSAADGNTVRAYYGVQWGGARQVFEISYNTLSSYNEVNSGGDGWNKFNNNTCTVEKPYAVRFAFEIKDMASGGANVMFEARNNTFTGYGRFGIFAGKSGNFVIADNLLTPADTATDATGIYVDTKVLTGNIGAVTGSTTLPPIAIYGNTINGGVAGNKGSAILFGNAQGQKSAGVVLDAFSKITLGGQGDSANVIQGYFKNYIAFKSKTGGQTTDPFWYAYRLPQVGATGPLIATNYVGAQLSGVQGTQASSTYTYPAWAFYSTDASTMLPFSNDINASGNKFPDADGLNTKLPAAMSTTELYALEDKIVHGTDWDSLGLVTVVPNNVYVTGNNFVAGKTVHSLKYAGNSISDGYTINVAPGVSGSRLDVKFNSTLTSSSPLAVDSLQFTGSSKSLTLGQSLTVGKRLQLTSGKLLTNGFGVTAPATATVSGGSANSYVVTSAAGTYTAQGVTGSRLLPIGSSTGYAPVTVQDASGDDFTAYVEDKGSKTAFTPNIPADAPAWVNKLWHVSEGTPGGSNAKLTFGWNASQTPDAELLYYPLIARNNAGTWETNSSTLGTFNAAATGFTEFGEFAVYSFNQELNVSSFTPSSAAAGQTVTVSGVGFTDGIVSLKVGGTAVSPGNYTVLDDSTLTFTVPVTVNGSVCVEMSYGTACKTGFVFLPTIAITGFNLTTACGGSSANISFSSDAVAGGGNMFGVQLSDKNGNFADSTSNVVGSGTTSPVAIVFPVSPAYGTGYKLRVLQSTPFAAGTATGSFELKPAYTPTATVSQEGSNPLCSGGTFAFTATVSGAPTGTTYQWKVDNANSGAATASTSFTTSGLSNGSTVSLTIVPPASACVSGSANSNTVTISGATSTPCGTAWTGAVSGDWTNASNWTAGVPNSGTNALLTDDGFSPVIPSSGQTATLTIDPSSSFTGSGTLNFFGAGLVNNGTVTGGTFVFNSAASVSGKSLELTTLEVYGALTLNAKVGVTDHVDLHGIPAPPPPRLGAPDGNENNNGNGNSTMAAGSGSIASNGNLTLHSTASHTAYVVNSSASSVITG